MGEQAKPHLYLQLLPIAHIIAWALDSHRSANPTVLESFQNHPSPPPLWNWSHSVMSIGEGSGTPLQYPCLENPMDRGAGWAAVHGVSKSWIRLSDFTFTFHFHALEKEMAAHSSVLAWRIPGTEEPGGLPSMGSHRVRHDWSDLAAAAAAAAYSFFTWDWLQVSEI